MQNDLLLWTLLLKKSNFLCKEFSLIQLIWTYHNHCYETIPSLLIWFEHSCVWLTVLVSENTEMNYTQYLSISLLAIKFNTKKSVKWHRSRALRKVFSWMRYTCTYPSDLYIFITCVYAYVQHKCGHHRTTCWGWFFSFYRVDPGVELRLSGLVADAFTFWAMLLALNIHFNKDKSCVLCGGAQR